MSDYIYLQAQRLLKRYHTDDPFALLRAMGVVLRFSDAYPRDGLRGYCAVLNKTRYVVINAKQPEEEQRVVAAHEAGHLVLHAEQLKIGALKDLNVYTVTGIQEREANFFAADFLMQDAAVSELLREEDADFFGVAQRLGVPAPFFAFKLYSMMARGYSMSQLPDLDSRCLKQR